MKRATWATAGLAAVGVLALAGCGSPGTDAGTAPSVAQNPDAAITAWVDDTRKDPAEEYAEAHPELKVSVQSVDNTQGAVSSRIGLATQSGGELPDVLFLSSPDEIATLLANPVNFPLPLTGAVDQAVLDGYADGAVNACTFGGQVYCLPNDLGQTVLYYDKTQFEEFGYTVPTTFADWKALGDTLAEEHPGYSLGSVSGRYGLDAYFGSSGCRYNSSTEPTQATIDLSAPECTRVSDVIGPMMANGTLSTKDPFDPEFTPLLSEGKLLATISPSWMGEYGIKPNSEAEGSWAVAPMPTWEGASTNSSGAVGGGIWVVSARSENVEAAIAFATAMSSDPSIQSEAPTYPAHEASAEQWLERLSTDDWYAEDPSAPLREAAGKLSTTQGFVRYQTQVLDAFNQTVVKDAGQDPAAALAAFGQQAEAAAESSGYVVSK